MGCENSGPVPTQFTNQGMLIEMAPCVGIHGTENIIHQQNPGVRIQRSYEGDAPPLPTTEVDSVRANIGKLAIGKQFQVFFQCTGGKHLAVAYGVIGEIEENIVLEGCILNLRRLGNIGDGGVNNPAGRRSIFAISVLRREQYVDNAG
jgi:hypothetical protein